MLSVEVDEMYTDKMIYILTASLFYVLIKLAITDLRENRLPNNMVALVFIMGLVFVWRAHPDELASRAQVAILLGALLYLTSDIYERFRKRPSMGMGDLKLLVSLAIWLPADQVFWFAALAFGVFAVWERGRQLNWVKSASDVRISGRGKFQDEKLPFGPCIIGSFTVFWVNFLGFPAPLA